jgi:hypothetical protein
MNFKKYFLVYTLTPLLILSVGVSYYRFVVTKDYIASYEIDCKADTSSCFIGCEDDECEIEYYYTYIERSASELHSLCGDNVTDCLSADSCLDSKEFCRVTFCDSDSPDNDCETVNDMDSNQ